MGFFIDRYNRRKSALSLYSFSLGIAEAVFYLVLYFLLSEPLYNGIQLSTVLATNIVHSIIVGIVGTLFCSLLFLLKDKQIAPMSAFCLAAITVMCYAAAFLLGDSSTAMIQLISIYALAPVIIENLIFWSVYAVLKSKGLVSEERKTITEELREAIAKENEKNKKKHKESASQSGQEVQETKPVATESETKEVSEISEEEALFGPMGDFPITQESMTPEQEAMLLFGDPDEEP